MTRLQVSGCQRLCWAGVLAFAVGLSAGLASAQNPTEPQRAQESQTPLPAPNPIPSGLEPNLVAPAAPEGYQIGRNDLLSIFVYQVPALTRQVRVSDDGTIRLPFLQRDVVAAGKTSLALEREIAARLVAAGLASRPTVEVTVRQVESRPIVVGGAVQAPVVVQAAVPMRLSEVLARAHGIASTAGSTVVVTTYDGAADPRSHDYNLIAALSGVNPAADPTLYGNEMVTVLPARMVYVVGDFKKPGAFPLRTDEPITVLKAVALAQGFDPSPRRNQAEIIHILPDGARGVTPVNIDKILRHQAPDPTLQEGDILYVPMDGRRKFLLTGLTDLAQLVTLGIAYHFP